MNSFTDTTDFMTGAAGAGAVGGASADFDEEQAIALAHTSAAATTSCFG